MTLQPKTFKNFLSDEDKQYLQHKIAQPIWKWGHSSNGDTNKFWKVEKLEFDEFFNPHLINKIKELTGDDVAIERIYFNGHTAGGHGNIHRDSPFDEGRTFLIYCNAEWNPEWGGGTAFVNEGEVTSYYPEPYSAIYFQNNQPHFAQPLSKHFEGLRVTCAFKLLKIG